MSLLHKQIFMPKLEGNSFVPETNSAPGTLSFLTNSKQGEMSSEELLNQLELKAFRHKKEEERIKLIH